MIFSAEYLKKNIYVIGRTTLFLAGNIYFYKMKLLFKYEHSK